MTPIRSNPLYPAISENTVGCHNKSAQSNLGRGPRRGAVAHVRRKVPIGYNGAPQIRPQKYPFSWTDPQTPLPASCLDTSDLRCQTASGSDPPFFHNALDRPTDRSRESLTTIGLCATTATRLNNTFTFDVISEWRHRPKDSNKMLRKSEFSYELYRLSNIEYVRCDSVLVSVVGDLQPEIT